MDLLICRWVFLVCRWVGFLLLLSVVFLNALTLRVCFCNILDGLLLRVFPFLLGCGDLVADFSRAFLELRW